VTYTWRIRKWLPDRFGQTCRVITSVRGPGPRNVLVEFEDGHKVVTTRWSDRRIK